MYVDYYFYIKIVLDFILYFITRILYSSPAPSPISCSVIRNMHLFFFSALSYRWFRSQEFEFISVDVPNFDVNNIYHLFLVVYLFSNHMLMYQEFKNVVKKKQIYAWSITNIISVHSEFWHRHWIQEALDSVFYLDFGHHLTIKTTALFPSKEET